MSKRDIDLWSLPIQDQAYWILVGLLGSWIYDALYDDIEGNDEINIARCQRIVTEYKNINCYSADGTLHPPCSMVQDYLNESYDGVMEYRAKRQAISDRVDAGDLCLPKTPVPPSLQQWMNKLRK